MDFGFGEGAGNAVNESFAAVSASAEAMEIHARDSGFKGSLRGLKPLMWPLLPSTLRSLGAAPM